MSDIYLAAPDPSLHAAIAEQMKTTGYGVTPDMNNEAAIAFIIDQAALDKKFTKDLRELLAVQRKCVLLLGDTPNESAANLITESFAKPLRLGHLLARLQFHLQAATRMRNTAPLFGPYRLEAHNRQIVVIENNNIIRLTEKETALLDYLAQSEVPVSREDLLAAIWGYARDIDTHTLETHIYQLRRKLDPNEEGLDILVNEQGLYRLNKKCAVK